MRDGDDSTIAGVSEVGRGEGGWIFVPDVPWEGGDYQLVVEPRLEDVAGNSPARVFDRDITKDDDAPGEPGAVVVSFACF